MMTRPEGDEPNPRGACSHQPSRLPPAQGRPSPAAMSMADYDRSPSARSAVTRRVSPGRMAARASAMCRRLKAVAALRLLGDMTRLRPDCRNTSPPRRTATGPARSVPPARRRDTTRPPAHSTGRPGSGSAAADLAECKRGRLDKSGDAGYKVTVARIANRRHAGLGGVRVRVREHRGCTRQIVHITDGTVGDNRYPICQVRSPTGESGREVARRCLTR